MRGESILFFEKKRESELKSNDRILQQKTCKTSSVAFNGENRLKKLSLELLQ